MARLRRIGGGVALAVLASLTGCGDKAPARASVSAQDLELGRSVYNFRCYFCHGYSGDARTLASTYLSPKPRDFTATPLSALPRESMLAAVRDGREGSAMKGFAGILGAREMEAVTDFVRHEFMDQRAPNTRYHTARNGWPDHERNSIAFPYARGEIAIDTPWESLDAQQQEGKRLFLNACITCHDHGRVQDPGAVWESRPVTFPRDAYCTSCHQDTPRSAPQGAAHPQRPATHTFAQPDGSVPIRVPQQAPNDRLGAAYLVHDRAPVLPNASTLELQGEKLFQKNCAFCHAADGTSKGWIGSFLEPHPRNLTSDEAMKGMTRERLSHAIAEGLPGTSMPAWEHVLGTGEIDALVAYIARAFHPVQGVGGP